MGDSDSEIQFNLNKNANEEEGEESHPLENAQNFERGRGDMRRGSIRQSVSPARGRRLSRQDRSTSFERRRTPLFRDRDWYRSSITISPDTYSGDDDWEQYISHFEDCAELGKWTEKEKVLTLAAKLKGQARVFYTSLPVSDKRSYRLLVARLEQRFGSARQQSRWISRLQSRVRKPGESIAALGDDLLLMAQKAYANLDSDAQEMLALQQFYKTVPLEMRCRIMDRDCTSISEAVDVVERYEELLNENTDRKRAVTRAADKPYLDGKNQSTETTVSEPLRSRFPHNGRPGQKFNSGQNNQSTDSTGFYSQQPEMNIDSTFNVDEKLSIAQALRDVVQRLDRLERGSDRAQGYRQIGPKPSKTCYICNSPTHFFRKCPKYRSAQTGTVPQLETLQQENWNQSLL